MSDPFSIAGQWFKGNLHVHTTASDGRMTPQETVASYAEHGYDFLSITDHEAVTETAGLDDKGMLLIPGIELGGGRTDLDSSYHMVAIGAKGPMEYDTQWSAQKLIDYGTENAEFVFMAHPYWLSLTLADMIDLDGCIGLEVYNTFCHHDVGRGESGELWDDLLARDKRMLGFAVDDAHGAELDAWIGYIMVKAPACEYDDIIEAIKAGSFYSSNGPTISNIKREGDRLLVECSPCQEVCAVCPAPGLGGTNWRTEQKPPLTEIELQLFEGSDPVRIECIDAEGNKAWSNPMWLPD